MTGAARLDPVVLIHGAWQGAWVWDRLTPQLEGTGLTTIAVDLPGNGSDATPPADVTLALYVAHVADIVARLGHPASLVAHSGGGVVASAVAEAIPEGIARIAYVAGIMLPDGVGFADLVAEFRGTHPEATGIGPHLDWSADRLTSRVPEEAARRVFFHDCAPADARRAAGRLTPQPERSRAVRPHPTAAPFGCVPRLYVQALADRAVIPALQRRMCALVPGAVRVALPTGHVPHLSEPAALAEALRPFLTRGSATDGTALAERAAAQPSRSGASERTLPDAADRPPFA